MTQVLKTSPISVTEEILERLRDEMTAAISERDYDRVARLARAAQAVERADYRFRTRVPYRDSRG